MPNLDYERLKYVGSFGLQQNWAAEIISHKMSAGYRRDYLVGARSGNHSWTLQYKMLPGTMDTPIQVDDVTFQSRAEYIWQLFKRSKTGYDDVNRPIIITDLEDNKDYLVVFSDHMMSRQLFLTKLYSSQLQLEQVRVRGVSMLPDGSLGDNDNPQQI